MGLLDFIGDIFTKPFEYLGDIITKIDDSGVIQNTLSTIGNAVDYTMEEGMGSDFMREVSELTEPAAKAILYTYAPYYMAGVDAIRTTGQTGSFGKGLKTGATNAALAYAAGQAISGLGGGSVGTGDFYPSGQEIMSSPTTSYGAGYNPISAEVGTGDYGPNGEEITASPETAYGEGYSLAPPIPSKVGTGDFNPETGEEIMASPREAYGPGYAGEVVPPSLGWEDYLKYANRLAGLFAGNSGVTTTGGSSGGFTGQSVDTMLSELMGRGSGEKGSRILSGEAEGPAYEATLVNQNEIDKYNQQGLYYT